MERLKAFYEFRSWWGRRQFAKFHFRTRWAKKCATKYKAIEFAPAPSSAHPSVRQSVFVAVQPGTQVDEDAGQHLMANHFSLGGLLRCVVLLCPSDVTIFPIRC